jgi:hypothetical protein
MTADEAYGHIRTILERQSEIREIIAQVSLPDGSVILRRKRMERAKNHVVRAGDDQYSVILQSFVSRLQIKPRPWGQFSSDRFGLSDGVDGVQWNIAVHRQTRDITLGVNLEGMKYSDWPIATVIQSELKHPTVEAMKAKIDSQEHIFLSFVRDAWQMASRPAIVDKYFGGRPYKLSEINNELWHKILLEARECLDESKNFQGRSKQLVTFQKPSRSGGQIRMMEVSPHLNIHTKVDVALSDDEDKLSTTIGNAIEELRPIHDWLSRLTKAN